MKTGDAQLNAAARRKSVRWTDFLFMGVAILPAALFLGGHPDFAMLLFIPLLFAACLYGAWEQVEAEPANPAAAESALAVERSNTDPLGAHGVIMRDRVPPGEG